MGTVCAFLLVCALLSVVDNNWLVACHVNYILLETINLMIIYTIDWKSIMSMCTREWWCEDQRYTSVGAGVLTNTVCCPRCAGLAQGAAHPTLHPQLRNLPLRAQKCTQQQGKCLWSSSCGMQLLLHTQAEERLPVGGKALPLAPCGWQVLAGPGCFGGLCVTAVATR